MTTKEHTVANSRPTYDKPTYDIWAIFVDNGEYHDGVYTDETDADNDMYGRPEGAYVDKACQCVGSVRPADECVTCGFEGSE